MSLLDKDMLPEIRRAVPQLYDVLQTEELYLGDVQAFMDWIRERMLLLRAEVMTPENLKKKIKQVTGLDCDILEDAEHLTVMLRYHDDAEAPYIPREKEVLMYVPAHLKVEISFLQHYAGTKRYYAGTACAGVIRYKAKPAQRGGTNG